MPSSLDIIVTRNSNKFVRNPFTDILAFSSLSVPEINMASRMVVTADKDGRSAFKFAGFGGSGNWEGTGKFAEYRGPEIIVEGSGTYTLKLTEAAAKLTLDGDLVWEGVGSAINDMKGTSKGDWSDDSKGVSDSSCEPSKLDPETADSQATEDVETMQSTMVVTASKDGRLAFTFGGLTGSGDWKGTGKFGEYVGPTLTATGNGQYTLKLTLKTAKLTLDDELIWEGQGTAGATDTVPIELDACRSCSMLLLNSSTYLVPPLAVESILDTAFIDGGNTA
ncbi:hypothetical protein FS842_006910 [Serendipita sp. 407]|nr:hypothetical protein FS842_006910 [Serendipita sp. 407]